MMHGAEILVIFTRHGDCAPEALAFGALI